MSPRLLHHHVEGGRVDLALGGLHVRRIDAAHMGLSTSRERSECSQREKREDEATHAHRKDYDFSTSAKKLLKIDWPLSTDEGAGPLTEN